MKSEYSKRKMCMSDNVNKTGEYKIMNALDAKRSFPTETNHIVKEQQQEEKKYRIEEYINDDVEPLNKFNWGACLIPPIWGLFNKSPITCIIILLSFIPYIGLLFVMGYSIYCGIKGNEWAWKNKEWVDMRQFHEIQRKWAFGGAIYAILSIVATAIFALVMINTLLKFQSF